MSPKRECFSIRRLYRFTRSLVNLWGGGLTGYHQYILETAGFCVWLKCWGISTSAELIRYARLRFRLQWLFIREFRPPLWRAMRHPLITDTKIYVMRKQLQLKDQTFCFEVFEYILTILLGLRPSSAMRVGIRASRGLRVHVDRIRRN